MTTLSRRPRVRRRFRVSGVVQGVGFRPFVYVTATNLGLSGTVANDTRGVVVEVEGDPAAVDHLGRLLAAGPPPLAIVTAVVSIDLEPLGHNGFRIIPSDRGAAQGARTQVSPDVATCADCLRELADPDDRRYRHPFISCTNCGPRWTIIRDLPYDRPLTTMAGFRMCPACRCEYTDPTDRRFHAQPIACHDCGPRLELVGPGLGPGPEPLLRDDALAAARRLLAEGAIVAVKGLGGYHLACDARNAAAVARLRARKRRGAKPFAVMVRDLQAVRELVDVDPLSAQLLTGTRRPVLLLPRRPGPSRVVDGVAPGNPDLGILLPYTPLHALLLESGRDLDALVLTSGNLGGEPIAYLDDDALSRLAPLADAWLRHDREIRVPVDDSVTRVVDGREAPVRRSRGYAPLPIALPVPVPPTLAAGADLKNTCAVGSGRVAWLSQHIGDLDDLATLAALDASAAGLQQLVGVSVQQFAADAHPGYRSSAWARRTAAGRPVQVVQHHHAHIASVMAEHGLDGSVPVIGIAFDGTGYGPDGAVWGGEVLVCDYQGFRRSAHLRYVPLPGGDAAVRRPYRMALSHLGAAGVPWDADLPPVVASTQRERSAVAHQLRTGFGAVPTSSMGRLFDAVSSLAGVRHEVDFEAQAAIELESLARGVRLGDPLHQYGFELLQVDDVLVADAAPVVRAVVRDLREAVTRELIAARFHACVVGLVRQLASHVRSRTGLDVVCLGGGVFGNALLLSGAREVLERDGFTVLTPELVPANDGGIALGQLVVAAAG